MEIKYKNLSINMKIAAIGGWISIVSFVLGVFVGFMQSL